MPLFEQTRAAGAVSLSFGRNLQDQSIEARQHVQQACPDANSLTKLIEGAMAQFNTHNVELDIEVSSYRQRLTVFH